MISASGFLRRLAAQLYDGLLLLAVLFMAVAIALPFNGGNAYPAGHIGFSLYLLTVSFFYYAWFWTHGGQTLGLKSWNLRLVGDNGGGVGWKGAVVRFFAAMLSLGCFGLGFLWCLVDNKNLSWHDRLSKTRLSFDKDQ